MRYIQRLLLLAISLAFLILPAGSRGLALPGPIRTAFAGNTTAAAPVVMPTPAAAPSQEVSSSALAMASLPVAAAARRPTATPVRPSQVLVPILMYHHLAVLSSRASASLRSLYVSPRQFDEEMAFLARNNYHTISFADLIAAFDEGRALPENPVILTFDDAWDDGYVVAFPVLQKYGLTGTFFVPSSWMGRVKGALTWRQIEEMHQAGMEFGSHSVTHPWLTRQKASTMRRELESSKAALEERLGEPVVALAYPFGAYNAAVVEQTREAGYLAAVTIYPGLWARQDNLLKLPRIGIPYGLSIKRFERLLRPAPGEATPTPAPMQVTE